MRALLIDDDPELLELLSIGVHFEWPDAAILTAANAEDGLRIFREATPDLVITDVTMPGRDGFHVLQSIREVSDVPVLMVTGRARGVDELRGLGLGADDYIVKPFRMMTLLARIKAVMRRAGGRDGSRSRKTFALGELSVDFGSREVRVAGNLVALTPREYELLFQLIQNAGRVVAHAALLERVWGNGWGGTSNDLKSLVGRLRAKIEKDAGRPDYIRTVRGVGYRLGQLGN